MATSKERDKEHPKGHLAMKTPPIVSQQEWEAARQQLLVKEKALTRSRDALAAERRRMPWMAVEKKYEFDGPKGKVSLLDLFEGRRQLIVYRAFFEPGVFGWPEHACRGCSFGADQVAHLAHLERPRHHPRVRLARAADGHRAPEGADGLGDAVVHHHRRLRRRLRRGRVARHNAFIRDGERVFRTYFINSRGDERWGAPGAISTSLRSGARRNGRTRQRVIPRPRRTSGGTGTTTTTPRPRLTRSGSRCPTLEKPPSESATQRRKRAKEGRPLRRLRPAGSFHTGAARVLPQGARSIARRRSWRTVISPPRGKKRR